MLDELLEELGAYAVELIKDQILRPEPRFTKREPQRLKGRYNFKATGSLYDSVSYQVRDEELYILMNDYGADYVFGRGSWPGGGAFRFGKGGGGRSELLEALKKWVMSKPGLPKTEKAVTSMAFAVRKNLFKSGYAGFNLFNETFTEKMTEKVEFLLQQDRYADPVFREGVGDILDRLNLFGNQTYQIAIL